VQVVTNLLLLSGLFPGPTKPVSSVGIDCGPAAVMPNVGVKVSLVQVLSKALVSANGAERLHLRMRWRCCQIYEYHGYSSGNI